MSAVGPKKRGQHPNGHPWRKTRGEFTREFSAYLKDADKKKSAELFVLRRNGQGL